VAHDSAADLRIFPLTRTDVKTEIAGDVISTTVTQKFQNPYADRIEAVYVFPLPNRAAVDDMEMHIGARTVRAHIRRRVEAQAAYDAATRRGQRAALLEQARPNVFTPRELFFLLDTSGSMKGAPLATAALAVRRALETMNPSDPFQIIDFADAASSFATAPLPNTPDNVRRASATESPAGVDLDSAGGQIADTGRVTPTSVQGESLSKRGGCALCNVGSPRNLGGDAAVFAVALLFMIRRKKRGSA
jgi:hypothetical protein